MSINNDSQTYFDGVAEQWDDLRGGYFTTAVRDAAIAKAYLRDEMVVADVGAGTGFMADGLAEWVSKVIAIEPSDAMLNVARKNLVRHANVEFMQGSAEHITLEDGSVDVVFANMVLHHCTDPLAAIKEMVRILKPGGRLVITDLDAHPFAWLKDEMADVWQGFERDAIREWFRQAGLVNVIVDCTDQNCCAESKSEKTSEGEREAKISVFVATGTLRLAMRESVQAAYSAAALGGCGCGGTSSDLQASCCGEAISAPTQDVAFNPLYTPEDLSQVPAEAGEIALGCGNPVALAGLRPGEVVLDIGSGGGIDAFLAARRVAPNGKVIGVDMTPAMLQRARKAAQKAGITNVTFRHGHAEKLPVEDNTVDVILSNCVINLCEDKGQVFREAFRVLKPGGRLEVSDIVTDGVFSTQMRHNAGEWAGCVSGALPEQEYLDLIAQARFKPVVTRSLKHAGEQDGVGIYSGIFSATKPGGAPREAEETSSDKGCGCKPGCCG